MVSVIPLGSQEGITEEIQRQKKKTQNLGHPVASKLYFLYRIGKKLPQALIHFLDGRCTTVHTYPESTPSTRLSIKKDPIMMRGMKYSQFQALPEASLLWSKKRG